MSSVFLRRGDRGPAVAEVRARLARLGLIAGSHHVRTEDSLRALMYASDSAIEAVDPSQWETTGLISAVFDADVEEAVRRFQRERGITVDGIVGPETFRRLEEARWRLGDRMLSYQPGHPLIGEDVVQLQRQLNRMGFDSGKEDSHFGPLTDRGLREFQRNTGVAVDGIAGPETLRALGRLHRTVGAESAHNARERYALPMLQTGIAGKSVIIDASPGSTDASAPMGGQAGATVTGTIARLTAHRLSARGAVVSHTESYGSSGEPLDELARARICNEGDFDLALSLHIDYSVENAPPLAVYFYGRSTQSFSAAGRSAAETLAEMLAASTAEAACTVDARTWDILRATRMPSVRVCFGQIAQPQVRLRLSDPAFHAAIANAISEGLTRFFTPRASDEAPALPG